MNELLIVGNHLGATGASRAVGEDLAERLRQRGVRVHTASGAPNKAVRLYEMLHATWSRRRQYEVAVVDVFSGQAFRFAEAVCALLRRLRKPYVLALRGGDLPRFAARHPRRVARILTGAAAVTSPSSYLRCELASLRPDILEIPNPIDCARYPFQQRNAPAPNLIWLRAFAGIYNPMLAPRVLAKVLELYPDCQLTMVGMDKGDGTLAATHAEIARLGVEKQCRILPKVAKQEVPQALASGDIFLNTANVDNTPVSVLEAMACGLCVISTNVGGLPHLLEHGQDSMLVPPDDAIAMADAVTAVLSSPELATRISEQGRRKAESCDWSRVLDRWMELLDACIARSRA
ncbi:MAG: glycosyltransferase family 4 protein [Planctomycetia bacterium]|nr:glycosyltransferase family 4 protein [Planctomycetia bacterium]